MKTLIKPAKIIIRPCKVSLVLFPEVQMKESRKSSLSELNNSIEINKQNIASVHVLEGLGFTVYDWITDKDGGQIVVYRYNLSFS